MRTQHEMTYRTSKQSAPLCRLIATAMLAAGTCLLATSAARSGENRSTEAADPPVKRTWGDVMAETEKVFNGCLEQAHKIRDDRPPGSLAMSATSSASLHPDTCYQTLQYDRMIAHDSPEIIRILDVRLERDYSHDKGSASSFRIVPNLVEHEGKLMYKAMLNYLKQNKRSYEVIDPQSADGRKLAERYRKRYFSP